MTKLIHAALVGVAVSGTLLPPAAAAPLLPARPAAQPAAGLNFANPAVRQYFDALPQNLALQRLYATAAMLPGEIRIEGWVRAVDPRSGRMDIDATAYVLPNGRSRQLQPSKPKTVAIGNQTVIGFDGAQATPALLDGIFIGTRVAVIGRDLGTGQILPARQVVKLAGP